MTGLIKTASGNGQKAEKKARATKTSPADVVCPYSPPIRQSSLLIGRLQISWSGCKDSQTSADAFEAGQATGAMSYVRLYFCYTFLGAGHSTRFPHLYRLS